MRLFKAFWQSAKQKKTDHGKVEELTEQKIDHDKVEELTELNIDYEVFYILEKEMLNVCCNDPHIGGFIKFRYAGRDKYDTIQTVHIL